MRAWSSQFRAQGGRIGLVPTMGYFHEGHLSLMRAAGRMADQVVVSLFVNPIQFGPGEDLDAYPRDFERDADLARETGVAVLFAPTAEAMYPDGFQTTVSAGPLADHLCGASRPGHFDGVCTVVCKLFNIVSPDLAVFGRKDFQQLAIIRRMVLDLDIPVRIKAHPIVREQDGLAMSSRNSYLDPEQRRSALCLYQGLCRARELYRQGETRVDRLRAEVCRLIEQTPLTGIDYVSFVDRDTLEPVHTADEKTVLALAVKIGGRVRLIDNAPLAAGEHDGQGENGN